MNSRVVTMPAVACVYILSAPVARYFHGGKVPGATMADDLFTLVEEAATGPGDRGSARPAGWPGSASSRGS